MYVIFNHFNTFLLNKSIYLFVYNSHLAQRFVYHNILVYLDFHKNIKQFNK